MRRLSNVKKSVDTARGRWIESTSNVSLETGHDQSLCPKAAFGFKASTVASHLEVGDSVRSGTNIKM